MRPWNRRIRKSMGYGGVPFDIVWKTETVEKPKIVAICDVSRSVAAAAQFMLLFLYSLNEVIEKLLALHEAVGITRAIDHGVKAGLQMLLHLGF